MDYTHQPWSQRSSSEFSKDTLLEKNEYYVPSPPRTTTWSRARMLVIHGILITIYSIIWIVVVQKTENRINAINSNLVESPAQSVMKDVLTVFSFDKKVTNKWFGYPPTPEVDQRWDDISNVANFRFSEDQMTRWGRIDEGVRLSDGSGYVGTLNVFHEMHCLHLIYQHIHKDHYYSSLNLTEYEQMRNTQHAIHCLEALRQGVQCRADITPVTFRFKPNWRVPVANWTTPHQCKDWDTLLDWAKENSFDPTIPGLVVHPTLGPAFEGEERAVKLGVELHPPENQVEV